jgi:hypothetical protein
MVSFSRLALGFSLAAGALAMPADMSGKRDLYARRQAISPPARLVPMTATTTPSGPMVTALSPMRTLVPVPTVSPGPTLTVVTSLPVLAGTLVVLSK